MIQLRIYNFWALLFFTLSSFKRHRDPKECVLFLITTKGKTCSYQRRNNHELVFLLFSPQIPLCDQHYSKNTKMKFRLQSHQRGHSCGGSVTLKVRFNVGHGEIKMFCKDRKKSVIMFTALLRPKVHTHICMCVFV